NYNPSLSSLTVYMTCTIILYVAVYSGWTIRVSRKDIQQLSLMRTVIMLAQCLLWCALALQTGSIFLLTQAIFIAVIAFTRTIRADAILTQLLMLWSTVYISYLALTSFSGLHIS